MPARRIAGQAATEYVALLLVAGVALAGVAAAVPGVGERVAGTLRAGLCIVGGDVCRASDAAAAGLEPCVVRERARREDTTLDVAVVRLGGHGEWQLALQSDGGAVVTRVEEGRAGATAGVGVSFSPAKVEAAARTALVAGYRSGRAWRFADARAAAAFLAAAMHERTIAAARPPSVRWHALVGRSDAEAQLSVAELARAGVTVATGSALGVRSEGARRTLTLDLGLEEPALAADLPGFPAGPGATRAAVVEVSWEGGAARELALRTAVSRDGRDEEYTGRLDLREPASRAVAERLLRPGASAADLRALALRMARVGVLERRGYVTSERRRGLKIAARLGVSVGLEHQRVASERRLTDAVTWVRGGGPQRRLDCLGV